MKKRIKKKFYDLYHQEVSLLEEEYADRWDFDGTGLGWISVAFDITN